MNLSRIKVYREERFAFNQDLDTNKYYLSFPVFNGYTDYGEYYEVMPDEFELIMKDENALKMLLEKSRNQQNDDRLLFKPGRVRGYPC